MLLIYFSVSRDITKSDAQSQDQTHSHKPSSEKAAQEKDSPKSVLEPASTSGKTKVKAVTDGAAMVEANQGLVTVTSGGNKKDPIKDIVKSPIRVLKITTDNKRTLQEIGLEKSESETETKENNEKDAEEKSKDAVRDKEDQVNKIPNVKSTKPPPENVVQIKSGIKLASEESIDSGKSDDKMVEESDATTVKVQEWDPSTEVHFAIVKGFSEITKQKEDKGGPEASNDADSTPQYYTVVKDSDTEDDSTSEATPSQTETSTKPAIRIKTVNATSSEDSGVSDQPNTSKVVMHLPGGLIRISEDSNLGFDLAKLLGKNNAQVTEVQQLPGGLVCYAVEESLEENQEEINRDTEKVKRN